MSIEVSHKVSIQWKINPIAFEVINTGVIGDYSKKLGSSTKAVNEITIKTELMETLMPNILGLSPDSRDINWHKSVKHYWDSLSED